MFRGLCVCVCLSLCMAVCWSRVLALRNRTNQLRRRLGCGLVISRGTMFSWDLSDLDPFTQKGTFRGVGVTFSMPRLARGKHGQSDLYSCRNRLNTDMFLDA